MRVRSRAMVTVVAAGVALVVYGTAQSSASAGDVPAASTAVSAGDLSKIAATAAVGAAAVGDLKTVTVTSVTSTAAKSLTATCPAGYVATGALATVNGDPYGVHVTEMWPVNRTVRVTAEVFAEVTPQPNWALVVTGLCVPTRPGYVVVQGQAKVADRHTDDGSRYGALSFALCPEGKELIGLGGRATGGYINQLQPLGKSVPYTNDSSDLMHGVTMIGKARPGASTNARVRAIAICADARHTSTFAYAETDNTAATKTVLATCPDGTQVRAVGFVTFYPNHYVDNTPFSYATLSRAAAAVGPGLTALQLVATRHRDAIPTEQWGLVPQPLCSS